MNNEVKWYRGDDKDWNLEDNEHPVLGPVTGKVETPEENDEFWDVVPEGYEDYRLTRREMAGDVLGEDRLNEVMGKMDKNDIWNFTKERYDRNKAFKYMNLED